MDEQGGAKRTKAPGAKEGQEREWAKRARRQGGERAGKGVHQVGKCANGASRSARPRKGQ